MKIKSFLVFFVSFLFVLSFFSFPEPQSDKPQPTNVDVQDAQNVSPSQQVSPIEVQIKDNKTQQTSTLVINPNEKLYQEIQEMKISLQQIQQSLDYLVNHVIADLEAENQQLKATLQTYGINPIPQDAVRSASPNKYIPGSPTNEILSPPVPPSNTDTKVENNPASPKEFYFRILEEWGRNPDVVKQMNSNASTIKGIIGVVPYGSPKEKLQELARGLRLKYDKYDNINIEIFDDEASAKEYIEKNIKNKEHNVLSISKHKESGRDIISIYGINESSITSLEPTLPPEN
ncbi:MAG TPA: hypothetical protein PLA12_11225 [Candidatus Hydrogenedens sp.]|nr:hypothetical protein [Candidatus Hydrogenedens sp.]